MEFHSAPVDVTKPAGVDEVAYWSRDASGMFAELGSGIQGRASPEAARRLQTADPDAIAEEPAIGVARLALRQFKSPWY